MFNLVRLVASLWFYAILNSIVKFANDFRIEKATRQYVGATLSGEEIAHLVKQANPEWNGGIYPSDCAGMKDGDTFTFRGKSQYNDLVLEYVGANTFRVLSDDQIVRKLRSGRGRGTTAPRSAEDIQKSLTAKLAALATEAKQQPAPPTAHKGQSKKGDSSATA